jgi:hypothetical protein
LAPPNATDSNNLPISVGEFALLMVLPFCKITIFLRLFFIFFRSIFQHSATSPRSGKHFSKLKKELPLVALFEQEKGLT